MSDTLESLRRKTDGARELESVVRTMKVLAASSIGQYERAISSLDDYCRTVEMGLAVYFRQQGQEEKKENFIFPAADANDEKSPEPAYAVDAVVFGSDQGLVGQFNDAIADFALNELQKMRGEKSIWAVGERIHARLEDAGIKPAGLFDVPGSVNAIAPLVSRILLDCGSGRESGKEKHLYAFYNRPVRGAVYEQASSRLLPFDEQWRLGLVNKKWPTPKKPEVISSDPSTLLSLVREYLFVILFRACSDSLASENASRLAAMQRAEKNIGEMLEDLNRSFHRLRQSSIDEELFDVISGFEALNIKSKLK
jgi:F-type H+-transporting ATPase subunit gamma